MTRRDVQTASVVAATGLLLGAGYVLGGFVPYRDYVFLPPAVAALAAAFAFGVRRSSGHRPLARLRSGAAWPALLAAALPLPYLLSWGLLEAEVRSVPVPAKATDLSRHVDPMRFDGRPDWQIEYGIAEPMGEADALVRATFARRGWKDAERLIAGGRVSGGALRRDGDRIDLLVAPNASGCRVVVTRPDPRPERLPW